MSVSLVRENVQRTPNSDGFFADHPVHTLMSRTGSFPLRVAYNLLKEYGQRFSLVFDPFCGKGTTLLAARMLGYAAYGMDIAPEAVVCSSAKMADVGLEGIVGYIERIYPTLAPATNVPLPVRSFFDPKTLNQILGIRQILMRDVQSEDRERRDKALFSLATLLGILHGHASYSLSIASAHAYSMAAGYVARFAAEHGLEAPVRDVKTCLKQKVLRCLGVSLPPAVESGVRRGSALSCSSIFPALRERVDLVLTSPPYLNAQTYAKDNWLRLWLLGHQYRDIQAGYIETGSIQRYGDYMTVVFRELHQMLKPGGKLICIAGDVKRSKHKSGGATDTIFKTGDFLAEICASRAIGFHIERYEEHLVPSRHRYYHALSCSNGHSKHSLVERVFVAEKHCT